MPDPNNIDEIIAEGRRHGAALDGVDAESLIADWASDSERRAIAHSCVHYEALAAEVERLRGRVTELETLEAGYVKVLREFIRGGPQ